MHLKIVNNISYEKNVNAFTTKDIHNVAKTYLNGGYIKSLALPEEQ